MSVRRLKALKRNESAAIAPLYAVGIFVLVGIAGVGFDYARMMSLHSELQNAADQSALAGASQLDGQVAVVASGGNPAIPSSCERAVNAVRTFIANNTRFADDGGNELITFQNETTCDAVGSIRFWQDSDATVAATDGSNANYIEVAVDPRSTRFALTPLVDAFSSGNLRAAAMAGLGSSICKVPPVMMCNPNESADPNFTISNYVGKGIRLVANVNGQNGAGEDPDEPVGSYGPGVFGYLETDAGNGAIATAQTLGRAAPPGDCVSIDAADVKPGQQVSVLDALNVRHGIFENGLNNVCGPGDALCPASGNARIDLVKKVGNGCRIHQTGFQVGPAPYRPTDPVNDLSATDAAALQPMGYPRDKCHAVSLAGSCTGNGNARIGNGDWDRNAYRISNGYSSLPVTWSDYGYPELAGRTTPTRYQMYRWEAEDANRLAAKNVPGDSTLRAQGAPLCNPPGVAPGGTPDRRILSIAVINCTAQNVGANTTDARIEKFVDVFLVEPTARRTFNGTRYTNNSDVYVEVVGATTVGSGGKIAQEIRRDVPYLVR